VRARRGFNLIVPTTELMIPSIGDLRRDHSSERASGIYAKAQLRDQLGINRICSLDVEECVLMHLANNGALSEGVERKERLYTGHATELPIARISDHARALGGVPWQ
jgi:hypothetical protein